MANRFLETNYFKSPFVRALKAPLKGLYSFIICDCTAAGIWALDMEVASMYIGFPVTIQDFQDYFIKTGKAIEVSSGKYFFPDFIEHQYPSGLQDDNKAHKNIISELKRYDFLREETITRMVKNEPKKCIVYWVKKKGALKGLQSPQGNGNGNGNGNGEGQGNIPVLDEKFLIPEMFKVFQTHLPKYPAFVQKDFQPLKTIADFIHSQSGLNGNIITNSKVILEEWQKLCEVIATEKFYKTKTLSTISNQIQEIYQISKDGNIRKETRKHSGNSAGAIYGNEKGEGAHATGL